MTGHPLIFPPVGPNGRLEDFFCLNLNNYWKRYAMLHFVNEENSQLKGEKFFLPDGIRRHLEDTLGMRRWNKKSQGYRRINTILQNGNITYEDLKRIKNFFDTYAGTPKSDEYLLNGGEAMRTWVDNTLASATKSIKDFKTAKKKAGISNSFKRPHEKDRQTKPKETPSITKFNTSNLAGDIGDMSNIRYEGKGRNVFCISEKQLHSIYECILIQE